LGWEADGLKKSNLKSIDQLTYLHVEEIIDPKATFSNEKGDVSEGGEFLEPLEKAKLFVENLAYDANSQTLAMLFEKVGTVGASLV
ncbi:unnamed protein product, partial [Brassica oleracea var. botrytis]